MASEGNMESAAPPMKVVGPDTEVWVMARIETAIRMAVALEREKRVMADNDIRDYAMWGIVEGAAREIIRMLGMEPEYVNIRDMRERKPVTR